MTRRQSFFAAAINAAFEPYHAFNRLHEAIVPSVYRDGQICTCSCLHRRTESTRLPWETGGAYGGWGGSSALNTRPGVTNTPVIFVHGNGRDACDWDAHREYFLDRGYTGDELWAITFRQPTPTHDQMVSQLDAFLTEVRRETGQDTVSIVAHSLGVTGVRYWLSELDRYEWVETFVGLAGANHGTNVATICANLGLTHGMARVSRFLRSDYYLNPEHPLSQLNQDETPSDVTYYTIRGAYDGLFVGHETSPRLDGAESNIVLATNHDGVRESLSAIRTIHEWVGTETERP